MTAGCPDVRETAELAQRFGCLTQLLAGSDVETPVMIDGSLLPFSLPSVQREKITAALDGGRIGFDGGAMLLALAERHMGIVDRLTSEIADRRGPARVVHALSEILLTRILESVFRRVTQRLCRAERRQRSNAAWTGKRCAIGCIATMPKAWLARAIERMGSGATTADSGTASAGGQMDRCGPRPGEG